MHVRSSARWFFVAPLLLSVAPLAHADDNANILLARLAAATRAAHTLRGHLILSRQAPGGPAKTASGSIQLMKPNLALIELTGNDEAVPTELASDGTNLFTFSNAMSYTRTTIDVHATQINEPWWALPVRYFFTQSYAVFAGVPDPAITSAALPDETINGENFHVVQVNGTQPYPYVERLYITQAYLLKRAFVSFGPTTFSAELSEVEAAAPLTATAFRFTPPRQATLKQDDPTASMLAIGSAAPAFHLPTVAGAITSLAKERRGSKATLINFWYLNCPPCRIEFPEFETLYQQLHTKGLNIVAIDRGDATDEVANYVRKAGLTFPVLMGGEETKASIFALYKASAFPVTYLIDGNGQIVYRAAGEDVAGLRRALAKLGLE